jgi:hypothetical protein
MENPHGMCLQQNRLRTLQTRLQETGGNFTYPPPPPSTGWWSAFSESTVSCSVREHPLLHSILSNASQVSTYGDTLSDIECVETSMMFGTGYGA